MENNSEQNNGHTRRDFMVLTATGIAAVGAVAAVVPLASSLNPAKDTLALSSVEVKIGGIQQGQSITVMWRGKPVFIRHRTDDEISKARADDVTPMRDPQKDEDRVKKGHEPWLIMIGICTHLGCVPLGEQGDYKGWFCPCHGSHYDTSGRIRKGPAPQNLHIPTYTFLSDEVIRIG